VTTARPGTRVRPLAKGVPGMRPAASGDCTAQAFGIRTAPERGRTSGIGTVGEAAPATGIGSASAQRPRTGPAATEVASRTITRGETRGMAVRGRGWAARGGEPRTVAPHPITHRGGAS
jgi:hypothetical protein